MKVGYIRRDGRITKKHLIVTFAGVASFAQERIFLDEKVRFSNKVAIYNELIILRLVEGRLSTDRLEEALRSVLTKHKILRTSLIFDDNESTLKQSIIDIHKTFALIDEENFEDEDELVKIIYETTVDANLFDLSRGRVFHCAVLRHNREEDHRFITDSDILLIALHHAAYDRTSKHIFLKDFCMVYNKGGDMSVGQEALEYIDYSVHERLMNMSVSREFWRRELEGYNLQRPLSLPVDRRSPSTDQRSGLSSTAEIRFDDAMLTSFFTYASANEVTPFQLGLAVFYAFLLKLTHGQNDLCVACLNANRYRTELQTMIGMFVAALPYRVQLDSDWSFKQLLDYVQVKSLAVLEHAHYPLQHILADSHFEEANGKFLETSFDFVTTSANTNVISFDGLTLEQLPLQNVSEIAKYDFALRFFHDATSNDRKLSFRFICSRDLFDETTVTSIARRFEYLCAQIFSEELNGFHNDRSNGSLDELTIILPEEMDEIERINFHRITDVLTEGTYSITLFIVLFKTLLRLTKSISDHRYG